MVAVSPSWSNWAGNLHYGGRVVYPRNVQDVVDAVQEGSRIQVVGAGHSFKHATGPEAPLVGRGAADAPGEDLVVLDMTQNMNRVVSVDESTLSCVVEGGCTIETIARTLEGHGLALENMPSIHVVTFAGAALTGTHGCGRYRGVVADMIQNMTVVSGRGEVKVITERRFFVHLGLLGVVVELTLRCVPFYRVCQRCYEGIRLSAFLKNAVDVVLSASHTQFWIEFTSKDGEEGKVLGWLRERVDGEGGADYPAEVYPGMGGKLRYQPVPLGESPDWPIHATTTGPWYDTLAFFRLGATLPVRESVQTEFFVELDRLPAALQALSSISGLESIMSHGCEVRPVASDNFALSPCNARFGALFAAVHFTLDLDLSGEEVERAVLAVQEALLPLGARPHWGKLFQTSQEVVQSYMPAAHSDCAVLWSAVLEWDPDGKFRNRLFDGVARASPTQSAL